MAWHRFHDRSANGEAVMNTGACLPKKKMEDFIELAAMTRDMKFNLYPLGFDVDKVSALNDSKGHPVEIMSPLHPNEMPFEYKKHRWLVYTASREKGTVGWPVSVAEAQASGVGACVPNLRPDLKQYVGEAGYVYESLAEARDIITKPFPEEKREMGFEHARKSDIGRHKEILTRLWDRTAGRVA